MTPPTRKTDISWILDLRPDVSSLIVSLSSLRSLPKWDQTLGRALALRMRRDLKEFIDAVERIGRVDNKLHCAPPDDEPRVRASFERELGFVARIVNRFAAWNPNSNASDEEYLGTESNQTQVELWIDSLKVQIVNLGKTVGVEGLQLRLPLTISERKIQRQADDKERRAMAEREADNEAEQEPSMAQQLTKMDRIQAVIDSIVSRCGEKEDELRLWTPAAGDPTAEALLVDIVESIEGIKARGTSEIRAGKLRLNSIELYEALKAIQSFVDWLEDWSPRSGSTASRGVELDALSDTANRRLKQRLNKLIKNTRALAKLVAPAWISVLGIPKPLREYGWNGTRLYSVSNRANLSDLAAAQWSAMSARKANIYGLL